MIFLYIYKYILRVFIFLLKSISRIVFINILNYPRVQSSRMRTCGRVCTCAHVRVCVDVRACAHVHRCERVACALSCHIMSYHVTSCRLMSYHDMTWYVMIHIYKYKYKVQKQF